ncbi:MAG: transposase family protein [Oligoflexia bacterium]|nr:transposase family protein [Oligoflexia bacterium]
MQFQTIIKSRVPGSHFTALYEHFAVDVILACRSIKDAASLLGISWDQVHHIQKRAVLRGFDLRELDEIKNVGIDVVKDRTLDSANELWSKLPDEIKENIDAAAIRVSQRTPSLTLLEPFPILFYSS